MDSFNFLKVLEPSEDGKMCSGLQSLSAFQCGYFLEVASCPHLGLTTPHIPYIFCFLLLSTPHPTLMVFLHMCSIVDK